MARVAASGRIAASGRVAASGRFLRQGWTPSLLGNIVAESWLDGGVTMGGTPRSQGTSPPILTYTGTLTDGVWPYVQIDSVAGGTGLGQATFKVSYDDGATFPHTGILTDASVAMPGVGSAITANWPAGPYNVNNIYQPLCSQVNDVNGINHSSESIAANQPILRSVAFNGKQTLDFGVGTTFGLSTPSVTIGLFSVFIIGRGDALNGYGFVTGTDVAANGGYLLGGNNRSSYISRSSVASSRVVSATWMRTSQRLSFCQTFDGTHGGHRLYQNGVDVSAGSGPETSNPGTGTFSASLRIGYPQTKTSSWRGLISGWIVFSRALTSVEVEKLQQYAVVRFPL